MTFWAGKRVLLTGHTGFKGSWMSLWLLELGADVTGYSLEPKAERSLFRQLGIDCMLDSRIGDIRDHEAVAALVADIQPDIVFHLAAQPLVLASYAEPIATFETNVMGTAYLLNALRGLSKPCAAVMITTDKVYENLNKKFRYRETDALGGHDPYSASKAASEIVISSWRRAFLSSDNVRVASARAGNVIGGGDWADNRIVPDLVRALEAGKPLEVRNPNAIRPWQHVLEPLSGYLALAEALVNSSSANMQDAFNFGPSSEADRSVRDLVDTALKAWPGKTFGWCDTSNSIVFHEAQLLALSVDRARERLGWVPRWKFERTVTETMEWYHESLDAHPKARAQLTLDAIRRYEASVR